MLFRSWREPREARGLGLFVSSVEFFRPATTPRDYGSTCSAQKSSLLLAAYHHFPSLGQHSPANRVPGSAAPAQIKALRTRRFPQTSCPGLTVLYSLAILPPCNGFSWEKGAAHAVVYEAVLSLLLQPYTIRVPSPSNRWGISQHGTRTSLVASIPLHVLGLVLGRSCGGLVGAQRCGCSYRVCEERVRWPGGGMIGIVR